MNPGAFVFQSRALSEGEIADAASLAAALSESKRSVHTGGKYAALDWFQVNLTPEIGFCRKILDQLEVLSPELLVFYYLEPGAKIHPHRDLTGASLNNRLRFHVPVITNPDVDFRVSGERIVMAPGDLWCLDTSYVHSVENGGDQSRVHIVIECGVNATIRAKVPGGIKAAWHNAAYAGGLAAAFVKAVVKNSVTDPAYFRAQMGMVAKFIGWRVLGRRTIE